MREKIFTSGSPPNSSKEYMEAFMKFNGKKTFEKMKKN